MTRAEHGSSKVSKRRCRESTSTRFHCNVLMIDEAEKFFSHRYAIEKIASNSIALSVSCGYSYFSNGLQKIVTMVSLYSRRNKASQDSSIDDSFSGVFKLHELMSFVKGLTIKKFPFQEIELKTISVKAIE